MEGRRWKRTQPGQLGAELGLFSVDAEPDCAGGVPGVDVLTFGHLGEVRLEGTGVVCRRVHIDLHASTSGDTEGRGPCAELVTSDIAARDISNEAVILVFL